MPEQPRGRHAAPESDSERLPQLKQVAVGDGNRATATPNHARGRHSAHNGSDEVTTPTLGATAVGDARGRASDEVLSGSSSPPTYLDHSINESPITPAPPSVRAWTRRELQPEPAARQPEPMQTAPTYQTPNDIGQESNSSLQQSAPSIATTENAIEVSELRKSFGDNVAVADISFSVAAGSVLAVLGPNGAGKTTAVNMLCTLLKPDGGSAMVAGHDVVSEAAAVRRAITLTGQFAALDEALSGRENLVLFGRLLGLAKAASRARADELLDMFGLNAAADRKVHEYSGGMRRRIDIACGLVTSPKVVFLDEPTTGLDPRSRHEVWSLVSRLRDSGVTTLLTTQYLEEADVLSDRIVVIDHGRVIAAGTADQLKAQTGGTVCEVTPAFSADLPRLWSALAGLVPAFDTSTENDASSIAIPAPDGTATLVSVVRKSTDAGIELSDVVMRKPSLDEVFLNLTTPNEDGPS